MEALPLPHSPPSYAMLLAIGLQESKLKYRKQIGGPALGPWQFEPAGVNGVLLHKASAKHADSALVFLDYGIAHLPIKIYRFLEYDLLLAACFARLLLYTVPAALPGRGDADEGWRQYLSAWRPGKPHPETWHDNFRVAWETVA